MAARTRTRIPREPSKRTSAPRWASRPASSGEWRNIGKGPYSARRLLTMASTIAWALAGTWSLLALQDAALDLMGDTVRIDRVPAIDGCDSSHDLDRLTDVDFDNDRCIAGLVAVAGKTKTHAT